MNTLFATIGLATALGLSGGISNNANQQKAILPAKNADLPKAIIIEAEDGEVAGKNTDSSGTETFKEPATSTNARPTSGGIAVQNWSYAGNTITWDLEASTEIVNGISVYVAVCQNLSDMTTSKNLKLTVNGEVVPWEADSATLPAFAGGDNWYDWTEIATESTTIIEGQNTVVLTNLSGIPINIDNIIFYANDADATLIPGTGYEGGGGSGGNDDPGQGSTSDTSQIVFFEAEDGIIEGVSTDSDGTGKFVFDVTSTNNVPTRGGKCVENWGHAGNTITWKINSNKATTGSGLSLWFANVSSETNLSNLSITINGTPVIWNEDSILPFTGGENYYDWQEISADNLSLVEGDNYVVLTNETGISVNIDAITLYVPKDAVLTLKNKSEAPVISELKAATATEDIKTNNPIKVAYTYSDDETATEQLKVTVNVYYDYGGPYHKKLTIKDGEFTPTQTGKYTVILRVTDEEGSETTETLVIDVTQEGVASNNGGGSTNTEGIVNVKAVATTAGIIAVSVAGAILVGFIVYINLAKRKKLASNFIGETENVIDTPIEEKKEKKTNKKEDK